MLQELVCMLQMPMLPCDLRMFFSSSRCVLALRAFTPVSASFSYSVTAGAALRFGEKKETSVLGQT